MANDTLSDDSADNENIFADKDNNFFHKGKVSNYRKEVVSHTSGEISISGVRSLPSGHIEGGGGGGSISTTHYHTVYFDIGNKSFAWSGNNPLSNGDEVALCSTPMANGYNQVECLKNITKGLFFKKDYREDDAYITYGKKIPLFGIAGLLCLGCVVMLIGHGFAIMSFLHIICSIVGYFMLSKVVPKRLHRIIIMLVALVALVAFVFVMEHLQVEASRVGIFIFFFTSGVVLGILGLEVISIMKDRREIIDSVKIINNAVLECE